jgi:hypothetical protein
MFAGIDPSKLDPKVIQELTDLMRTLPPGQLMKMQTIMHNSMAGIDVTKDVQAFEASLKPEFRERLARLALSSGMPLPGAPVTEAAPVNTVSDARLMLLRAVRDGSLTPEDALSALFP